LANGTSKHFHSLIKALADQVTDWPPIRRAICQIDSSHLGAEQALMGAPTTTTRIVRLTISKVKLASLSLSPQLGRLQDGDAAAATGFAHYVVYLTLTS